MSTELATFGPLCQAAIITFKPFESFFQVTGFFLVVALLLKLIASLLKTKLLISKGVVEKQLPAAAASLTTKYTFPAHKLFILDSPFLLAFSSVLPGIADGIFLSKNLFTVLSEQELEAVFLHELYHWRAKQTVSQLALKLCADVFFFIPLLQELVNNWQLQSELAADAFASTQLKTTKPLKEALHKWLAQDSQKIAWTVSFAEMQLHARIDALSSANIRVNTSYLSNITLKGFFLSAIVLGGLLLLGTSDYSHTEATLIIPTNTQCKQVWQQTHNQSAADAIMSPKID
jgi:Zn-dependent protease with chaperone function